MRFVTICVFICMCVESFLQSATANVTTDSSKLQSCPHKQIYIHHKDHPGCYPICKK